MSIWLGWLAGCGFRTEKKEWSKSIQQEQSKCREGGQDEA